MRTFSAVAAALSALQGCQALNIRDSSSTSQAGTSKLTIDSYLDVIRKHAGLYKDKSAHPEFANTVLVTASNTAYGDFLKNWRCHADKLGLDYVVLAYDGKMAEEIGQDRAVYLDSTNYSDLAPFAQGHYNDMCCMRLRVVKDILAKTGLNVVFTDPDNVFGEDPFAADVSLGQKMRQGQYDFIYSQNHGSFGKKDGVGRMAGFTQLLGHLIQKSKDKPDESDIGAEVNEGNGGFFFVAGGRKEKGLQGLFEAGLMLCSKRQQLADQQNFWEAIRAVRSGKGRDAFGADNFACANLCGKGKTCSAPDEEVLNYCEMDPWNHATGWDIQSYKGPKKIVTFHGNYVGNGLDVKIGKLDRNGYWDHKCVGSTPTPASA